MSLLLDISRLRAGVDPLDRRFEPSAFEPASDDFRVVAPVELALQAHKDVKKIRLTGRVRTTLECACGRCLDPFAIPVDAAVDALFLPAAVNQGAAEQEIAEEDLGVSFYHGDTIDLGEVMREQFYLALPMKPLCREDCRGLCPVCGVNRNREQCECKSEWVDPRLQVLKRFTTE